MFRAMAITLVVGGIAMIVVPWLCTHYYIGALTSLVVRTRSGDPELFVDLSETLRNFAVFGVCLTSLGIFLGLAHARKSR